MLFSPIKPMLLSWGKEIQNNDHSLFDIKWDGLRLLLHKEGEHVEAYTRHGNRVTHKFPEIQEAMANIQSHRAIIDAEGVVLRNGNSVFDDFAYRGLLNDPNKIQSAMETHPVTFIAFDVLETERSHIKEPLIKRKQLLADLVVPSETIATTPYIIGNGEEIYRLTKEKGVEGVVEKAMDSVYQLDTRSPYWKKYKHFKRMDTVIMGYKEKPFAMIVGAKFSKGIQPVATVEFGFKPEEKQAFRKIATQIVKKEQKGVTWIEPALCCQVQYLEKTEKNHLRIVSFKGFNFDKKPEECTWS